MKVMLFIKIHNFCCRAPCLYKASTFESSSETKMAKTRNLTQIISQEGYSCRQIARKCRCSPSAVGYTLQKYRQTNSLEDKPRSGRPRVSSARNDRILIRMCRENHRMTSQELQQQLSNQTVVQCSTRTVCGRLLDHGLRSYKAVKKPETEVSPALLGPSTQELDSQELEKDSVIRWVQFPALSSSC